ncbi:MAG: hypothetical protein WBD20_18750 [Pirellulaceae bacterium]
MPIPIEDLPNEVRDGLLELIDLAAEGNPQPLLKFMKTMLDVDGGESDTAEVAYPQGAYPLSNPKAAEILFAFESDDSSDADEKRAAEAALKQDPDSVEALAILGDLAESLDEQQEYYRRACAAVATKDPQVVARAMPPVRARLCEQLMDRGQVAEACEILLGSFEEDPDDNQLLRIRAVDLTLRLGWDDELLKIIDSFRDDEFGPVPFARAILEFKNGGGASSRADALLRAADELVPGVASMLTGNARIDFEEDEKYEASVTAQCLLPGIRAIPGTVAWVRETLDVKREESDGQVLLETDSHNAIEFVLELDPTVPQWYLVIKKMNDAFLTLFLSDAGVVLFEPLSQRPKTKELRELLLLAITSPMQGEPSKPHAILVPTKADFNALNKYAATLGIECRQEKLSSELAELVEPMLKAAARDLSRQSDPDVPAPQAADIDDLPTCDETWLLSVFQPPMWIHDRATPWRPWMQILVRASDGVILKTESDEQKPTAARISETIRSTMADPLIDSPRRPIELHIDPKSLQSSDGRITPNEWLESDQIGGAEPVVGDDKLTDFFNEIIASMLSHQGPTDKALIEQEDVDADSLLRLYDTASRYYRSAPWKMVSGDALFDIRCQAWDTPAWTGCVLGQLGQELGLALYDQPADARRFMETEDASLLNGVVIHFAEMFEAIPVDMWYLERHSWPVANTEAYPFITRIRHGRDIMCPSASDLDALCEIMKHTSRFLDHPRDQPLRVDGAKGEKIEFQWV